MRRKLWLVLLLLPAFGCEEAPVEGEAARRPPVEVESSVDRAVATTGDVITYEVKVSYDPQYEIDFPETAAEIQGFRVVDLGRRGPRRDRGRVVEERWYELRADLVGSYVLPPVTVTYRPVGSSEEGTELQSSEIFVEVESVLPADGEVTDIRDLKPLRRIESEPPWLLVGGAGGVAALGLAGVLYWWRRRREPRPEPPVPAHELAFAALDRLRQTDFADPEAVRRFHFEISEVVRAYVEGRFGLNATDLTTEEILDDLDAVNGMGRAQEEGLRRFLLATDRVKFAAHEPSEEEIEETWERALSFVEKTRPAEAPEEVSA